MTALELHDSTLLAVRWTGADAVLELRPAYVHRLDPDGTATGWAQDVDLRLASATVEGPAGPARLSDGWIAADGMRRENMIPLPFRSTGAAVLHLEAPNDFLLRASAGRIEVVARGAPRYLEPSPWDGAWPPR